MSNFFTTAVISQVVHIRGGWEGVGWVVGRVGSRKQAIPSIGIQAVVLCPQQVAKTETVHRLGQDVHW